MRTKSVPLAAALLVLAATAAWAAMPQGLETVQGTVVAVDPAAGSLTVRVGSQVEAFSLAQSSTLLFEGRESHAIALGDLQPGDYVSVEYSPAEPGTGMMAGRKSAHQAGHMGEMMHNLAHRIERKPLETVQGTVVAVDPAARTLSLRTSQGVTSYKVADDSPLYQPGRAGEPLALRELRSGDQVTVEYRSAGSEMHIQRLARHRG